VFDHVTIRVTDRGASERFYETVLAELGIDKTYRTRTFSEWDDFSMTGADAANPLTRRDLSGPSTWKSYSPAKGRSWTPRHPLRFTSPSPVPQMIPASPSRPRLGSCCITHHPFTRKMWR
jgi:catechol 2,3-dioxygenase-like lactoylglutathione lyase family enzyme